MTPRRLPLVSSEAAIRAFERLGFEQGPVRGGSHVSMRRPRTHGGHDVPVVVLDRKEIPRGTPRGMLRTGNVTEAEFVKALRRRRPG